MVEAPLLARLRAAPPFAAVDAAVLARLVADHAVCGFAKGAVLLLEGERPRAVHLLLAGRVALTASGQGGQQTVITLLGEGDLVAVPPVLLGFASPVGAVATIASEAIALDAAALAEAVSADAALGQAVMAMLARHWCGLIEQMKDLKLHDSRTRVARWLAESARGAGGAAIKLGAPKAMLARNLGMTPESFSRALAALEAAGAIAAAGSSIAILDRGLLDPSRGRSR